MASHKPFMHAARSLASDGLDILFGALKEHARLPARPSTARSRPGFGPAITEAAEAAGAAVQWNGDGTLALLTVGHAGRHWQVIARDHARIVEFLAPVGLSFPPGRMPSELADHLLSRTIILFGGYVLCPDEGQLALHCRAALPADALAPALVRVVDALAAEVADLYDRLRL